MDNKVSMYRAMHKLRQGHLHHALGVPMDKEISSEQLADAKKHKNPHVAAMAHLASLKGEK